LRPYYLAKPSFFLGNDVRYLDFYKEANIHCADKKVSGGERSLNLSMFK